MHQESIGVEGGWSPTAFLVLSTTWISFGLGMAVLSTNRHRFTNQVLAAMFGTLAAGNFCIYNAVREALLIAQGSVGNPVPYLRANGALGAFSIWILWTLKRSLIINESEKLETLKRSLWWLVLSIALALLAFHHSYIPSISTSLERKRGWTYMLANSIIQIVNLYLGAQGWLQMRHQKGIRRLELQFFVINLSIASFLSAAFSAFGNFTNSPLLKQASILSLLVGCSVCAWAVTYHRVFDIRQVFILLLHRSGILILMSYSVFYLSRSFSLLLPGSFSLFFSVGIVGALGFWLNRKSSSLLDLNGERALAIARLATIDIALKEPQIDKLIYAYQSFLKERWKSNFAVLLFDEGSGTYCPASFDLPKDQPAYRALCSTGWSTPESLERRRPTRDLDDLHLFIIKHQIGAIVVSPTGGRSLIIALGEKKQSRPFTYPEISRLQNIAELIDSILTRSRLTTQAALQARVEHLAMVSRGLAHDLKNLITPVSSFLIHTDNYFPPQSIEAEVHADARRSVRVMTDYVREALFFSERLAPRIEEVDLGKIFTTAQELTSGRATQRGLDVCYVVETSGKIFADGVLLQRLLVNLINNALDACSPGQHIKVTAFASSFGRVRIDVADEGCGIAPENLERVFEPYFTTKEFGEEVRGFGLGLTVCQKIVHVHGGTISVKSELRRGTTFTVELPVSFLVSHSPAAVSLK
jgi:signal transduction histidine kinase